MVKKNDQRIKENLYEKLSMARLNVWYTFERLEYAFGFVCAGWDIREPLMRFEEGMLFASTELSKDPLNID